MRHTGTTAGWHGAAVAIAAAIAVFVSPAAATISDGMCVLIREGLHSETVRLVQISGPRLAYIDSEGTGRSIGLERCLGLFDPEARLGIGSDGVLELADGQRLPGQAISNEAPDEEVISWNHGWLGRMKVPLGHVRSMRLRRDVQVLEPGDTDQVQLINGDLLRGFVISLGDPISLEIESEDGPRIVDVPIERAAAVSIIAPTRSSVGRRVWFRDGTVLDATSVEVDDDGIVRVRSPLLQDEDLPQPLRVDQIAAILFDSRSMLPLAALEPSRMSGPPFRYSLPAPRLIDPEAPLDLGAIEFRGPLVVHYALPAEVSRFAAEARLPQSAATWGDFELVIRDDDRVVFRARLDAATPSASINVPLQGSELTIELTEGRHGPVQDTLVLERAMIMVGK